MAWREKNPLEPCCNLKGALCSDCRFYNKEGKERVKRRLKNVCI